MRISWRLGLRILLVMVVAALVWMRIASLRHRVTPGNKPITDLAVTMPLNQAGGSVAPADTYEVYSTLYQAPMPEPLVFSEDSATDIPQADGSCLKPATPEERETSDAFAAANRQSHRWEPRFSIAQGYRLLAHSELAEAQTCLATHGRDVARCQGYKDVRYVRFLGVPGFDHTHTHALVSVIKSCGGLCGTGGIFAVEKTGGMWQRSLTRLPRAP